VIKDFRTVAGNWMSTNSVPGIVVGLSIKGKTVFTEGFGYTDIENDVKTDESSVWRLASISKPLTSALVGLLIDKGKIDLNKSIHEYLPKSLYPNKSFNGKPEDITVRQVLSHTAGLHMSVNQDFYSF